jgi:predicted nucleic acid-binding Zn ribbon protein
VTAPPDPPARQGPPAPPDPPARQGPPGRPDRARLAREALDAARADARARGNRPAASRKPSAQRADPAAAGGYRRPRRDRNEDPQPLAAAIDGLIDENGWALAAATGSVFGRWPQIVGPELAAHTAPESLSDGELTISADSTAWATQVRLLARQLVRRLNVELGDGVVRRVRVRGPVTAQRRAGEWRVRGGRGPRDTYG